MLLCLVIGAAMIIWIALSLVCFEIESHSSFRQLAPTYSILFCDSMPLTNHVFVEVRPATGIW